MRRITHPVAVLALVAVALSACGDDGRPDAGDRFDGQAALADVEAQVGLGPRPSGSSSSRETVRLIADRLREAGVEDVRVQRPHANVVGTIPGSEPGAVVVGAHHDTKARVPGFVGANDGASGVAVVLGLAESLPRPLDGPSIHLALFDAEEARGERDFEADGTRGSRQYVAYAEAGGRQGSPPLAAIRATVVFDMVGDCDLQIPREAGSDPGLYELFAEGAAQATGAPVPFTGETGQILDDHVPFRERGIPALDLIDFSFGPGPAPGGLWHTAGDTFDRVCAASLDAVGEAAIRAIPAIR
ncbi:MAG: M28 family metallopeptidase [bacterium]